MILLNFGRNECVELQFQNNVWIFRYSDERHTFKMDTIKSVLLLCPIQNKFLSVTCELIQINIVFSDKYTNGTCSMKSRLG